MLYTNVSNGEVIYTLTQIVVKDPNGLLLTEDEEISPLSSIVRIKDRTALLPYVHQGFYNVEIRAAGYKTLLASIKFPNANEEDGPFSYSFDLQKDESVTTQKVETVTRGTAIFSLEVRAAARGKYYALIIGNNDYQGDMPKLETAVKDAEEIHKILLNQYGFESKLLLNAKRAEIIDEIYSYTDRLEPDDNLLIYYAGHGYRNRKTEQTYWQPIDASPKSPANWISSDDILTNLKAFPAKHILIISDSCFAGTLVRDANIESQAQKDRKFLLRMIELQSKTLIASGGDEPVADTGINGHSPFANALIDGLNLMEQDEFSARELFNNYILKKVVVGSNQTPIYRFLPNLKDEGGDFVFIRKK